MSILIAAGVYGLLHTRYFFGLAACKTLANSSSKPTLSLATRAQGMAPIHNAADKADVETLKDELARGVPPNVRGTFQRTPLLRAGAPLPDLDAMIIPNWATRHPGLPYLRKVRAAGSFANYERQHIDKLTLMLTPKPDSDGRRRSRRRVNPLRRLPTEVIRNIAVFAFHAGFY